MHIYWYTWYWYSSHRQVLPQSRQIYFMLLRGAVGCFVADMFVVNIFILIFILSTLFVIIGYGLIVGLTRDVLM